MLRRPRARAPYSSRISGLETDLYMVSIELGQL
jgi:hypothetical protein